MKRPEFARAISPPDPGVLAALGIVQTVSIVVIVSFALPAFLLWIFPSFKLAFFPQFHPIKANTAFLILLAALSVFLSQPRFSRPWMGLGSALGALVAAVSIVTSLEFAQIVLFPHLDTLFAPDPTGIVPGRMALQSSLALVFIGLSAATIRVRQRYFSPLVDVLTFCMCLFMLIVVFGYAFGAMHLFGLHTSNRLYPSAFISLILLALIVFNRRAEYGFFSVLLGSGIGGKTARLAAPWAVLLPFLLTIVRGLVVRWQLLPEEYSTEGAAAILSILGFGLLLVLSRRSDLSEIAIRELSLRDELTRLYNRRGFYILAEQALRLARRDRAPFSVLFIDIDNLKPINDLLGHEVGSDLLIEMAHLLEATFREIDVVGRLGGDEFVVAARCDQAAIAQAAARLVEAARESSTAPTRSYHLSFSLGFVTSDSPAETLDDLLARADNMMYESKRSKKALNPSPTLLASA